MIHSKQPKLFIVQGIRESVQVQGEVESLHKSLSFCESFPAEKRFPSILPHNFDLLELLDVKKIAIMRFYSKRSVRANIETGKWVVYLKSDLFSIPVGGGLNRMPIIDR